MTLRECVDSMCSFDGVLILLGVLLVCAGIWMSDPGEVYKTVAAGLIGVLVRPKT